MGELCRYAVLRDDPDTPPEELARAKQIATRHTEAVLLLAYIPSWKGCVPAFVRYNEPGTNRASAAYLREGREFKINLPDENLLGCNHAKLGPAVPEDWATGDAMPEIVFKNVEGFIARSYHVNDPVNDPIPYSDGVFYRKKYNADGKLISVRVPTTTYKGDDTPALLSVDSTMPIPERLRRLYTEENNPVTGKPWGDDDITFKGDTSNDELVGHYAVWHLAYDILAPDDPELGEIIKTIVARHAKHMKENGGSLIDAGGQPTSWARMTREYYMNKGADGFPDAPLGTTILLQLFKVAYHITGDAQWEEEYRKLALDEPYRYADLCGEHFARCEYLIREFFGNPELPSEEIFPVVVRVMNYSDVRMAAVAFYTLSQLETDPVLIEKYRKGSEGWWALEKYARDVEWSLVYQLLHPEEEQFDAFGRSCIDMLKWQLNRYPVNSREMLIDNTTRPDLREEGGMLWYRDRDIPYAVAMDERGASGTNFFHAKSGITHRRLSVSYNMIMPYWIARYHGVLKEEGRNSNIEYDELFKILNQK